MSDTPEPESSNKGGNLVKVVGVVFGAVVAPIVVGVAIKYLTPRDNPPERGKPDVVVVPIPPPKLPPLPPPP